MWIVRVAAVALAFVLSIPPFAHAAPVTLTAALTGDAERPAPVATAGSGQATLTLDDDRTELTVALQVANLSTPITAAHIHVGSAAVAGPIIFSLATGAFTSPLVKTLTAADLTPQAGAGVMTFADAVAQLVAGNAYVNVHTAANPGGEIRGQVAAVPTTLTATLTGAAERPAPVATALSGRAILALNAAQTQLTVELQVANMSASPVSNNITAAHIHVGSAAVAGPIVLPLATAFTSPLVKTLTAADLTPGGGVNTFADAVAQLLAGNAYVNVHTAANPGGEIRGQVAAVPTTFTATLTGAAERPAPVATAGSGRATVTIDPAATQLAVQVNVSGLSNVTAAHIHVGSANVAGPIIFPLATAFTSPLVKTLTAADLTPQASVGASSFSDAVARLFEGNAYVNVHTAANPGGEIRGQLGLDRPTFASPSGPAQLQRGQAVTFTWTAVPGAANYAVVVSRPNVTFNRPNYACTVQQIALCELDLALTSFIVPSTSTGAITLPPGLAPGRYEVRVIGVNATATETVGVFSDVIPVNIL